MKVVSCIITGKSDKIVGAKIYFMLFGCDGMQGCYIMDDTVSTINTSLFLLMIDNIMLIKLT